MPHKKKLKYRISTTKSIFRLLSAEFLSYVHDKWFQTTILSNFPLMLSSQCGFYWNKKAHEWDRQHSGRQKLLMKGCTHFNAHCTPFSILPSAFCPSSSCVFVWHVLDNIQLRSLLRFLHTDANATWYLMQNHLIIAS